MEHASVTVLASGIVLDKSKLPTKATDLGELMANVYSLGKRVLIVDNASGFFKSKTLLDLLEKANPDWNLVAEKFNLILSESDLTTMTKAVEIRKNIITQLGGISLVYNFAEIPDGVNVNNLFRIIGTSVYRKKSDIYSIGILTLKRIWDGVKGYWAENPDSKHPDTGHLMYVTASGYSHRGVSATQMSVTVGCQQIQRYELEQFALQQGWEFP